MRSTNYFNQKTKADFSPGPLNNGKTQIENSIFSWNFTSLWAYQAKQGNPVVKVNEFLNAPNVTSLKVSLKEMRCPSFSVSTRTPSQSNRRADGRVEEEEEEAEQVTWEGHVLIMGLCVLVMRIFVPNREYGKVLSWDLRLEMKVVFLWDSKVLVEDNVAKERLKAIDAI